MDLHIQMEVLTVDTLGHPQPTVGEIAAALEKAVEATLRELKINVIHVAAIQVSSR